MKCQGSGARYGLRDGQVQVLGGRRPCRRPLHRPPQFLRSGERRQVTGTGAGREGGAGDHGRHLLPHHPGRLRVVVGPYELDRTPQDPELLLVALSHHPHEDGPHHPLRVAVVGRAVALAGPLHATLAHEMGAVQGAHDAVPRRRATAPAGPGKQRHAGEDEGGHQIGPGGGEVDGDAATERVAHHDRRRPQLGTGAEEGHEGTGVVGAAPGLLRRRRGPEAGQVDGEDRKIGGGRTAPTRSQGGGVVGVGPGPTVEGEDRGRGLAPSLAEERPTGERAQHEREASQGPTRPGWAVRAGPEGSAGPTQPAVTVAGVELPPRDRLLAGLTPEQRAAVTDESGLLCVLAGAGSGKTTVLTRRVAWRLHMASADADHVLVLTFTRKAASELRARLAHLGAPGGIRAGTFHSAAYGLLRRYWADRDIRPPSLLGDPTRLLREAGAELGIPAEAIATVAIEVAWARARLVDAELG